MKGCKSELADPMEPMNEFDDRVAVKALIDQHREKIDKTKAGLRNNTLYDPTKHDDLWILRFLLSHKFRSTKAIRAAEHTLAFRSEHKLDDADIRPYAPGGGEYMHGNPQSDALQQYLKHCKDDALKCVLPNPQRGVIILLNMPSIDQHAVVEHVSEEDWLPAFLYINEWSFQWLDYITRTTGRLTKTIRLCDTKGSAMKHINRESTRRDGEAMGKMEDVYPQLLQALFLCNVPTWVQIPWRILRPIMPKRVVEKFDFINPNQNQHEKERLLRYMSNDHLPERFGGNNAEWPVQFALLPSPNMW